MSRVEVKSKVCQFCEKPESARGMCSTHYRRWLRHGDAHGGRRRGPDIDLTDVELLAITVETLPIAADRLGVRAGSLAKYLHARGRRDLLAQFAARGTLEPGQWRRHAQGPVDEHFPPVGASRNAEHQDTDNKSAPGGVGAPSARGLADRKGHRPTHGDRTAAR